MRILPIFFQCLVVAALLLTSLCSGAHATPGEIQLSLQLLRAGVPAADVPCTIRQFDEKTGMAKPPRRLKTDSKGQLKAEVILPPPPYFFGIPRGARLNYADYVLIDAKDAPLVAVDLAMFRYPKADMLKQIELIEGGEVLMGKLVQGNNSEMAPPVVGADVTVVSMGRFLFNDKLHGVSTPQLIGKSGDGGMIQVRPVNCYNDSANSMGGNLVATYKENGQLLKAHITGLPTKNPATLKPSFRPRYFLMSPSIGVGGRVVEAKSGRPIEGATVNLRGSWLAEPMFATTNKEGQWRIEGIPPQWNNQFSAIATHPKYGLAGEMVQIPKTGDKGWILDGTVLPDTTIRMAGLTTLKGRIIDDTTGKAPQLVSPEWPMRPLLFAAYSTGDGKDNNLASSYGETEIGPDGSFSMAVPVGSNYVSVAIPFFHALDNQKQTFDVGEQGVDDVVIRVKRDALCMVVKFVAENPKDLKDIQVFDITTKPLGVLRGGDAISPYYMWGSNVRKEEEELRVRIRYGEGKTIETTFTRKPENWPQIVVLPAKPPKLGGE